MSTEHIARDDRTVLSLSADEIEQLARSTSRSMPLALRRTMPTAT